MLLVDLRERTLGLDDAERAAPTLISDDVVQAARLVDPVGDGAGTADLPVPNSLSANFVSLIAETTPSWARARLAQPARRLREMTNQRACFAPMSWSMPSFIDSAPSFAIASRIDALRAALVAEVAPRAIPDPVLLVELVQARDLIRSRGLRRSGNPWRAQPARGSRVGLHRVALGAAAAHDAERLLVDHVHRLLGDDPLLLGDFVVAGSSHGLTARILFQNGPMSTTRSRTIGRLPIAEITRTCPRSTIGFPLLAGEHRGRPCASRKIRRSSSGSSSGRRASRPPCP